MFSSCFHMEGFCSAPVHLRNTSPSHPSCSFLLEYIFILKTCVRFHWFCLAAHLGFLSCGCFFFFFSAIWKIWSNWANLSPFCLSLPASVPFPPHPPPPPPPSHPIPAAADIDECQIHNGGCQHTCVNTRGSYYCECRVGSRLHVDGRTCLGELLLGHTETHHRCCGKVPQCCISKTDLLFKNKVQLNSTPLWVDSSAPYFMCSA